MVLLILFFLLTPDYLPLRFLAAYI